jgi:hypothetical protein
MNLDWSFDLWDWLQAAGPLAVARELDGLCAKAENRATRVAACYLTGSLRAREGLHDGPGPASLDRWRQSCRANIPALAAGLRAGRLEYSHWGSLAPRHREATLRVSASGTAGLAGRIPECDGG